MHELINIWLWWHWEILICDMIDKLSLSVEVNKNLWTDLLFKKQTVGFQVSLTLWNARRISALRQVWMMHLVRKGSSSAAAESAIDWAALSLCQVMDWIYPFLDKAQTRARTPAAAHASTAALSARAFSTTHTDNRFENLCDIQQAFRRSGSKAVMYCQQLHG